jgi:hypothetical protein
MQQTKVEEDWSGNNDVDEGDDLFGAKFEEADSYGDSFEDVLQPSNEGGKAEGNDIVELSDIDLSRSIFNSCSDEWDEWPGQSAKFYLRELDEPGSGLKGIVYNALLSAKRINGFSALDQDEMFYHLFIASTHNNLSQKNSKNVTTIVKSLVTQHQQEKEQELEILMNSVQSSIWGMLSSLQITHTQMENFSRECSIQVKEALAKYQSGLSLPMIPIPISDNTIRTCYCKGKNSIARNLPFPTVLTEFNAGLIPSKQVINHFLAAGLPVSFFRAGHDDDWFNSLTGQYDSLFMRNLHHHVRSKLNGLDDDVTDETRVILVRLWSDGFEAHKIKVKNNFNNLQLFTLTILAPPGQSSRGHTSPLALCFKMKNHHDLLLKILSDLKQLESPTIRFWGGEEKKPISTMVFLEMISNDLPERCANTCTTLNGTYTHRWRHSCSYNDRTCPSCKHCELGHIMHILGEYKTPSMPTRCEECNDWWSREVTKPDVYPLSPEQVYQGESDTPPVEISFKMMECSIKSLFSFIQSKRHHITNSSLLKTGKTYLQMVGLSTSTVSGLVEDMLQDIEPEHSTNYPLILKKYKELGIEMNKFGTMPMHLCFLGIEKSLISKTDLIVRRSIKEQNLFWHSFIDSMDHTQSIINSISIDWCLPMTFSNLEKLSTANWQSDHYLGFTRISLYHFAFWDFQDRVPETLQSIIIIFKRLRVIWFCIISRLFTNISPSVSPPLIDSYMRLFLSTCHHFSMVTEKVLYEDNKDKGTKKRKKTGAKEKTSMPFKPFYTTKSNYFSLLNFSDMTMHYGSLRNCWEGENEKYIQNLKKEMIVMRHTDTFPRTILQKVLISQALSHFNEDNPYCQKKVYARTGNMKFYKPVLSYEQALNHFNSLDVVSGMIDSNDTLFVAHYCDKNSVSIYRVHFDDSVGKKLFNLWYSEPSLSQDKFTYHSKGDVLKDAKDYFLLLKLKETNLSTIICQSWRVRNDEGILALPEPDKDILLMN